MTTLELVNTERFEFGKNWRRFLSTVGPSEINEAKESLCLGFDLDDFRDKKFIDVGCGSGLFSLAARQLGAQVHSFDYDVESVNCAQELKSRFLPNDQDWTIEQGSAIDKSYFSKLGQFDLVYSWGVLHHTGDMYKGLQLIAQTVKPGGTLFIAIYNDQGPLTTYWSFVKKVYNQNKFFEYLVTLLFIPYLFVLRYLVRLAGGRSTRERGMLLWYDMRDWLGGSPFEVALPEEICEFYHRIGFKLQKMKTCKNRCGCNEYIFQKVG